MAALIILIALALLALFIVSAINRKQEQEQARRQKQRKLKLQADAIADIVNCIEQTIPNRLIAKYLNDASVELLQQILLLETGSKIHIENSIRHALLRSEALALNRSHSQARYQKDSDAQINQTQVQLGEAAKLLNYLCTQGRITDAQLELFTSELAWAFLMVSVVSFIAQGYKFTALQDRFSSQGYYQKAQNLLMESVHPDQRRLRMIKELSEMIEGTRTAMSQDLVPPPIDTD